jgi:hypothetical protein
MERAREKARKSGGGGRRVRVRVRGSQEGKKGRQERKRTIAPKGEKESTGEQHKYYNIYIYVSMYI